MKQYIFFDYIVAEILHQNYHQYLSKDVDNLIYKNIIRDRLCRFCKTDLFDNYNMLTDRNCDYPFWLSFIKKIDHQQKEKQTLYQRLKNWVYKIYGTI